MIKRWGPLVIAPLLGMMAMILPVIIKRPARWHPSPLVPVARNAVEHVGPWQLLLLFLVGVALGALSQRRAAVLGLTAILLLPVAAIAEMFADPTSHNLWPFEFVIYGLYGCIVAAGVAVAHRMGRRRRQPEAVRGA
jgi:hypothetical protein